MIKTRIHLSELNRAPRCETYSTIGRNLIQQETGIEYGPSVIDVIAGYDSDGKPYSRYTYIEAGLEPGEIAPEDALDIITGGNENEEN